MSEPAFSDCSTTTLQILTSSVEVQQDFLRRHVVDSSNTLVVLTSRHLIKRQLSRRASQPQLLEQRSPVVMINHLWARRRKAGEVRNMEDNRVEPFICTEIALHNPINIFLEASHAAHRDSPSGDSSLQAGPSLGELKRGGRRRIPEALVPAASGAIAGSGSRLRVRRRCSPTSDPGRPGPGQELAGSLGDTRARQPDDITSRRSWCAASG